MHETSPPLVGRSRQPEAEIAHLSVGFDDARGDEVEPERRSIGLDQRGLVVDRKLERRATVAPGARRRDHEQDRGDTTHASTLGGSLVHLSSGAMTCDSCGREADADDGLAPVRRKYVKPGAWDEKPSERVMADLERWCFACLTHYPHEPA